MPGTALTVPGAFRLEVLPPAATGASQVRTTWLDKTPPVIKSIKARIDKPWGAASGTLIVDLVGTADGAGIAAVNVKAGSKTTKFDADTLTDLIAGKGKAERAHQGAAVGHRPHDPRRRRRPVLGRPRA